MKITIPLAIIIVIVLDELAIWWWKQLNPGSKFSLAKKKYPLQEWYPPGTNYPNGYRPAGAG